MKKILTIITVALISSVISLNVFASAGGVELKHANTDITDKQSLRNGAKLFMDYCSGCHSIKFMRYNRIGKDLNISNEDIENNFIFGGEKIGSPIVSAMSVEDSDQWFGNNPDLSLVARSKGVDWIYSYLHGFYKDEDRIFGVNNHVLENASMPDVLWSLKENKPAEDFDQDIRDITNFLDYVGEPAKLIRSDLGYKVLGFLFILLILSYLLKKEYWKDVKYGKWRAKD